MISLEQIENDVKRFYENSFELSLLQEELENMLTSMDRNNIEFEKGKISKNAFELNEVKLKKNSVRLIKKIKALITSNRGLIKSIIKEIENQKKKKTETKKRARKKTKPEKISEKEKTEEVKNNDHS